MYVKHKYAYILQHQSPFVRRTFIVFLKAQSSKLQYILLFSMNFFYPICVFIGRFYAYLTKNVYAYKCS